MLGLIGKKLGMTQVFDEKGNLIPVTVIQVEPSVGLKSRTAEKNGYSAAVLGVFDAKKEKNILKPVKGQFPEGVGLKKKIYEVRDFSPEFAVGSAYGVELFKDTDFVDVIGISKGKGFQGVMKRYNFAGGPASHGSKFHREAGGTGLGSAYMARTVKGTKQPGRMGGVQQTVQNLKVVSVDEEKQVVLVKGAVPGKNNSVVFIRAAKKK